MGNSRAMIAVTGVGMVSSIGPDVVTSCAAARAGLIRLSELDLEVVDEETLENVPLVGHTVRGLSDGFEGLGRLISLGAVALKDLLTYSGLQPQDRTRKAFFLHLPDDYYDRMHFKGNVLNDIGDSGLQEKVALLRQEEVLGRREHIQKSLMPRLLELCGLAIPEQARFYSFGGPAGFVGALGTASELLRTGGVQQCILGGIDSYVQREMVEMLYGLGLVRTPQNTEGFFPGEAAAFVLLERLDAAGARGARVEGLLRSPFSAKEPFDRFSEEAPLGRALSQVMTSVLESINGQKEELALAIGNLNGDAYRAKDFGNALLRMRAAGFPADFHLWTPAMSFGEVGAATGPISICLGIRALQRGYAPSQHILIWHASDSGERGAFLLSKPLLY